MNKKIMEDVVVHHVDVVRSTLQAPSQQIRPRSPFPAPKQGDAMHEDRIENNPFFEKAPHTHPPFSVRTSKSHVLMWVTALLGLFGVGFLVASYFTSAAVTITPLTYQGHIDQDLTALKDNSAASSSEQSLAFHFISLADEKSQDVPATISQDVQKKASGKVIIYNAYSKDVQRLIKNTRLESADHKIFRIDQSVVVPGAKIVAGKVAQPGAVEVLAYADVSGKELNIGLGDFTIPGFKGDPRYSKFTARSKLDSPMAGGYSGSVKVPSDSDIQSAQSQLKQDLKSTTIEKARALIPAGMTFFPGSTVLKFEEVPQDYASSDTAKVVIRATASVFFFDTVAITKKIAASALTDYKGNEVLLSNIASLSFVFADPVNNVVLADLAQLRFRIAGDPIFVGVINSQKIQNVLAGKNKADFAKIIVDEKNIGKAETTIRPMWKTTFPQDPSKITVDILTQ